MCRLFEICVINSSIFFLAGGKGGEGGTGGGQRERGEVGIPIYEIIFLNIY